MLKKRNTVVGIASLFLCIMSVVTPLNGVLCMEQTIGANISAPLTIQREGRVNDRVVAIAQNEMNLVPIGIRQYMEDHNWHVYVTDKNLAQEYFMGQYDRVAGVTYMGAGGNGYIAFENRESAVTCSVPHEVGHAMDYELGDACSSAEFQAAYRAEAGTFRPSANVMVNHVISDVHEYYAAVFDEICRNEANCRAMAPRSYAFVKACMDQLLRKGSPVKEGWASVNGRWQYIRNGSPIRNQWLTDGGNRYYFLSDGFMATGWVNVSGKWYYLNQSGAMVHGWVKDGNVWYYLRTDGTMAVGWIKDGGKWYYLNQSGAMVTGWVRDGSTWYYMDRSGAMATGWVQDGRKWYYLNYSGAMMTGWVKDGNHWYYLDPGAGGAMATGYRNINGTNYYFSESTGGPLGALQLLH